MFAQPDPHRTVATMLRRLLFLSPGLLVGLGALAAVPAATSYDHVEVAAAKTSIYVGFVALTMPTFVRHGTTFSAPYTAKVFPYFFYNEHGTLSVDVTDTQLDALTQGRSIEFTGVGVRDDGAQRRITVVATPTDPAGGKLKVRLYYSKRINLVFNTTYRFRP